MELAGTVVNAAVVAAVGVVLAFYLRGRFEDVRAGFDEIGRRFEQVDQRFDQVDRRFQQMERRFEQLEARMDVFHASLDGARSDITRVALAVGAGPRAGNA